MRKSLICGVVAVAGLVLVAPASAGNNESADGSVTFAEHVAPILQRSCQNCHRPESVAPMPLLTYEQVRPWARAIKQRITLGPRAGVMPPWYVERSIGIQRYKNDPSLSEAEIATVVEWVDSGAPAGDLSQLPPPRDFSDGGWSIGEPDLIVKLPEVTVGAEAPDWWGEIESTPVGLDEDRYVAALEFREVNDYDFAEARDTVGGRYVFHHMIWSTQVLGEDGEQDAARRRETTTGWPVHEVGRNADIFDPKAGRLLAADSSVVSNSVHLHSNGRDMTSHLEIAFKFHPRGYEPTLKRAGRELGNGLDIDIRGMQAGQELHSYTVLEEHQKITTFEPHLHAPGERMCLEAIWGNFIETLSCVGYDHNWVRTYEYADDHAPLLPKGTILHITGYMNNSPTNRNVPDPRNWQGSGNRSVTNMFIDLGLGVELSDEQFLEEMAERRRARDWRLGDHIIGCPLCGYPELEAPGGEGEEDEDGEEAESEGAAASAGP